MLTYKYLNTKDIVYLPVYYHIIPNFCGLKFCDLIYITFCDSFIHDFEVSTRALCAAFKKIS